MRTTENIHRILLRASKAKDGVLNCPDEYNARLWMSHLHWMAYKGYIKREGRVSYITEAGRAQLEIKQPVQRRRARPPLLRINTPEPRLPEIFGRMMIG